MRRLPPLSALPAFEATARLGSVTAAAAELGRTHSAVSKQISHLAEDLGGGLFEKAGNGLKLTPRGERLRKAVTPMLDELAAIAQALRAELDDRHIDIVTSATFATRWLIPRLPRFYAGHPEVEIGLRMSGREKVPDHEIDVVLSYDRLRSPSPDFQSFSLGNTAYGPVCAPDYPLRKIGEEWIAPVRLLQAGVPQSWREWMLRAGETLHAEHDVEYAHHFLALEAAAAGLGVALAERRLVEQDLATRRLIAPLGFVSVEGGLQAAVMPRARSRKAITALLEWLAEEARDGAA
ncbi:DNA-binding transcriptional LysR family regulator [Pseudochelatococcus lubricantis]|uniref:DNA-binding transcriptional LysR family regulator n=1 Tax=Pseudochelatococcus lubricantis TaxID=1538102 RepID=A0ABX0V4X5_9HYPH|nr:LysR substrate-binding domain-containing protein [Pseudochelatococcus lubricantis]NIJ60274.1 DNA-binding transcriptional LysR family regulator [Pseudochelatococcus lubricantis]